MITVDDSYTLLFLAGTLGKRASRAEPMFGAMSEREGDRLLSEGAQNGVMGNSSERHDYLKLNQSGDCCREKGAAIFDFGGRGFVLRRHAAHGICDQAGHKAQAVGWRRFIGAGGKAKINQSFVQEAAREIASKGAPGSIRAAQAGR